MKRDWWLLKTNWWREESKRVSWIQLSVSSLLWHFKRFWIIFTLYHRSDNNLYVIWWLETLWYWLSNRYSVLWCAYDDWNDDNEEEWNDWLETVRESKWNHIHDASFTYTTQLNQLNWFIYIGMWEYLTFLLYSWEFHIKSNRFIWIIIVFRSWNP